jgi:hypothetical protein
MLYMRATVYRPTTTVDSAGASSQTWTVVYNDVRCYVEQSSSYFQNSNGRMGASASYTIFFQRTLALRSGDKVVVTADGKTYLLTRVELVCNHHLECSASYIESPQTGGG